jgi:hypothetical protein
MWIFKVTIEPPVVDDGYNGEFPGRPRSHFAHVVAMSPNEALTAIREGGVIPLYTEDGYLLERIHPILYKHNGCLHISKTAKKRSTMYKGISEITGQEFKDSYEKCKI